MSSSAPSDGSIENCCVIEGEGRKVVEGVPVNGGSVIGCLGVLGVLICSGEIS